MKSQQIIKAAELKKGVHPYDSKELTAHKPIERAKLPDRVVIPMLQHIGIQANVEVSVGEYVKTGQVIGTPKGFVSSYIHASISGKVVGIGGFPHPSGKIVESVVIEGDGKDEKVAFIEHPDYLELPPDDIRKFIREAGIVGLGGATFPTDVKLTPPKEKPIDIVILNGAECEPYLTSDHRLMIERSKEIVEGLRIIMRVLSVEKGYIGIEDNKPEAIEHMKKAVEGYDFIEIVVLPTRYPQGAEKILIKVITGREVPSGGLPMDVGVVVQNVGTANAIYEALRYGKPLIERVVTVTGRGIREPKNLLVRLGMFVEELINECGGLNPNASKIIMGGPMMGIALPDTNIPVIKGTSGVLVMGEDEIAHDEEYYQCIRCGRCVDICPMGLMPSTLSILAEKGYYEETKEYNIMDCFECGSCAYVCPSKRPIVQLIKLAKSMLKK
ncbi:MAG: electron transport complex subunit RsxC [Nitrospirae bacterium]|nr:MAG: electron transport complex subunit RsxC [Nitrospirota bacterium]